ncbi:MAG TPA: glycosyltransferase family 39 protein, partial [Planctomycetota bacterium]|nr:glycosyltransferase family 39 protein [Planctomycetota bacterium]
MDPDEPRYAAAGREMARGGDLLVPELNGEPRLNKPILFYWIEAASLRVFGEGEAATRLPSALAASATVLATAAFAASRFGPWAGLLAGAVLACAPGFVVVGRVAIPDAVLGLFVTLAFYAFDAARRGSSRAFLGFATALGLAAATKGLPGVLPLSIALGIVLVRAREPFPAKGRVRAAGIAIFAILALAWPLALAVRLGAHGAGEWLAEVLGRETVGRFFGGYAHREPITYYAPVLLAGFYPFVLLLPWAIPAALRAEETGPRTAPALLAWASTTFVFFSLSSSKLGSYLQAIYPPLAILAGRWLAGPRRSFPLRLTAGVALLLAVAAPLALRAGG